MSRRARSRLDKRAQALDLARIFGHGTPLPSTEDQAEEEGSEGDFIPEPDTRRQIGPLDVAAE